MPTVSFTHRIDGDLKTELDEIARFDNRTPSFLANHAIRSFVEERKATRDLIETGLALVEANGLTISTNEVHDWLLAEEDQPFPKAATS